VHTSPLTYWLFIGGIAFAALGQIANYVLAITTAQPRLCWRTFALALGFMAIGLAASAGYRASIDWSTLPTSSAGLRAGQLWDDGGIPAIVEKPPCASARDDSNKQEKMWYSRAPDVSVSGAVVCPDLPSVGSVITYFEAFYREFFRAQIARRKRGHYSWKTDTCSRSEGVRLHRRPARNTSSCTLLG
jgi:hypothetical protein